MLMLLELLAAVNPDTSSPDGWEGSHNSKRLFTSKSFILNW